MGALNLQHLLVGVSHECDVSPEKAELDALLSSGKCVRLTSSEINPMQMSQDEINRAVIGSLRMGGSLYGILEPELRAANPTVVLTQALCDVCAPSAKQVNAACGLFEDSISVINLEPHSLSDVAKSFVTVSRGVTGSTEAGENLAAKFHKDISRITSAVSAPGRKRPRSPRCVLLEWSDPLFDGGHWIPDMLAAAGGDQGWQSSGSKSKQIDPSVLADYDPDCILVACCGFDLGRNLEDAQKLWSKDWWRALRCVKEGRVFAADGNRYFARPGPSLVGGVAILARVMHDGVGSIVGALELTKLLPEEGLSWARVAPPASKAASNRIQDIEDACWHLHKEACERNDRFYIDPITGYQVMTEVAHKNRGRCCGCGCRHCPYSHAGVPLSERAARIKNAAWLHKATMDAAHADVLFWSGGKDSFLALRTLQRKDTSKSRLVVLLTTFDVNSRIIAHQDVSIETVVRQAKALGVSVVGVPLHPGRNYEEQVQAGLEVIRKGLAGIPVQRVCFGDLHLDQIRSWREKMLTPIVHATFGASSELHYPIWLTPYEELMADLVASGVQCRISAVPNKAPKGDLVVGAVYSPELAKQAKEIGWDSFGENGEFHSVVEPWIFEKAD